jgi:sec-independent protein translocase protein TatA
MFEMQPSLAFLNLGFGEMVMIGVVGLLVFGNRLPTVAKSIGQSIVQFKKGLKETQADIERAVEDSDREEPRAKLKKGE